MTAVHQFVATIEPGAIGNEMLQAQRVLREAGYESEIFAEYGHDSLAGQWAHHTAYAKIAKPDDLLVYHMAIGSNVADWLLDREDARIVLRHHNITPVEYYSPWPDANTYGMAWGRDQLRQFAPRAVLGLAASEFNRQELESLRYKRTAVAPVFFDVSSSGLTRGSSSSRSGDWLFVGWLAPHKCQHDVILAFSMYRKLFDENAHLHLVGRTALASYEESCRKLVSELGLENAVTFHGRLSDDELKQRYESAGVFVCMSEHEGVGLPLLESMYAGIPIVAFGAAAVPETVGDAGIVLPTKKPATVAAAAHRLLTDATLQKALADNAKQQVERFGFEATKKAWLEQIGQITHNA